ncbi:AraC family transcriptional regulator [Polyangium spumosum]|uniref:Helix-turn-helix domain-containing protein n=1 Tax=Polyangium spumosum TaxID=889282 RepID=A0A6N7Q1W7_9BACT|nr:AraC family transcriptional regulator [Polyangium spumosum]MRG98318.1 helix-turn-helix domain-containing protein [Polyangium spumosum]
MSVTSDDRNDDFKRQPTHDARLAGRIVEVARASGVDTAALCHAAGLSGRDLQSPGERVPLTAIYTLVEAARVMADDPLFGVKVASGVEVDVFDVLGFLILTSPTFGAAMGRTMQYQRLWNDGERYSLVVEEGRAHLRYEPFGPERPAHHLMAQMFAFDVGVNAPRLVAEPASAVAIRFRGEPPPDRAAYEVIFQAPVSFASPVDEVVLPADLFDQRMPLANEAMHAYFQRHADAALARLGPSSSLTDRVRTFVSDHLPERDLSLAAAAASLRMSARTLQRRLRAESTSYEDLVDDVRRGRAMVYLDARLTLAEVAHLLGYAEQSVFHRAFKRWTGMPPEAWRAHASRG